MSTDPRRSLDTGPFSNGQYIWAKFARHEKRLTFDEYHAACAKPCCFNWFRCQICASLDLTVDNYEKFISVLPPPVPGPPAPLRSGCHMVVLIRAPGREPFVFDSQGHSGLIGLNVRAEPPEIQESGSCLGRWVRHPENGCAVIDFPYTDLSGSRNMRAIGIDETGQPTGVVWVTPDTADGWRWAYSDPDYEKMPGEELHALRTALEDKQRLEKERRKQITAERKESIRRLREEYLRQKPAWAQAAFVAELREPMEGTSISFCRRTVFLAWSRFAWERYSDLDNVAAIFPPTAGLAINPEAVHRLAAPDATGYRMYLGEGAYHSPGWKVRKVRCSYIRDHGVEWNAPEMAAAPDPEPNPETASDG